MGFVFGPSWFYSIGFGFGIFSFLVTLLIAFYSLKVYNITRDRRYLYFTLAFLSVTASYIIRAAADYVAYTHLIGRIPNITQALSKVASISLLYSIAYFIHVFLMLAGFMILVAVFMRIDNIRTVSLLFILLLFISFLSQSTFFAFHVSMIIMLLYIVIHLFHNHSRIRRVNSFIVLYSMLALLVSQVFLVLVNLDRIYIVVGNVLQLAGFVLLLLNMVLVFRK